MANATAPKQAKKTSRQPPSDTVWVRYHPWMEGAMGHLASWSIHLLIIGVAVLVSLAYAWGFIKHNQQLPVEPVQFADAGGGGSKDGSGDGPGGEQKPPEEGVKSDKPNEGNTDKPADRVQLTEAERQRAAQEFPAADGPNIQRGPESMNTFRDLDKELSDKLRDGITPANGNGGTTNGNGGTGKDGGMGSGKDKGVGAGTGEGTGRMLNEREKRAKRWHMDFIKAADKLDQLDGLGCILLVGFGPHQYKVIRDLSKPHPPLLDPDPSLFPPRPCFEFDSDAEGLMRAMGYNIKPLLMRYFIPPELEKELAQEELDYKGLKEDQISETRFEVFPVSGPKRYDVRVKEQHAK